MGGDGGGVIQRIDMVRTKGYASAQPSSRGGMGFQPNSVRRVEVETVDFKILRKLKMTNCALTGELLVDPIVACRAGWLYNKESVLQRLLSKSLSPEKFSHISSLRDLVDVRHSNWVCPLTQRQLNDGVTKAVVIWPCGCLLSAKSPTSLNCLNCQSVVTLRVFLYPDSPEVADSQMKTAQAMRRKEGEKKKRKLSPSSKPAASSEPPQHGAIFKKIFHDPTTKVEKTDAFGRGFSSKGVGI